MIRTQEVPMVKPVNVAAKRLADPRYRRRVVTSKKVYSRKRREKS